ncbi:MAG: YigZ family protein [Methanobrevibacter sp.]|uniref:YigZ family protein n=1 Tax=Methanobrevibacter sp. TaxID=66852 RepID=UPI0026E09BC4|nr:YigZ family protein [Methanobrevibacter sp.]MDO5849161.1 YigZ family protein [Methanobrevibacter sp.]
MKTIAKESQSEIKIKKSQFICRLFPTNTKAESKEIIQKISEIYSDATHNCTAYITIDGEGYDDNGEPSGTAGKPMLNALRKNDLHNITAIVTRYFGGIKLGAGGLVRAYGKSVLEAINNSEIVEIELYDIYTINFEYADMKIVEKEIRENGLFVINKEFKEKVSYEVISAKNIDIKNLFKKFSSKINVKYKNREPLKKIEN